MKKLYFLAAMAFLFFSAVAQQGVGINTDGSTPSSTAILDVKSTTKGVLLPRMTTGQRQALTATNGLIVYDNDFQRLYQFQDGIWRYLINNSVWASSSVRNWTYNTTDSIGIGVSAPSERLHVLGGIRGSGDFKLTGDAGIGIITPEQRLHVRSSNSGEGMILEADNPIIQLRQSNAPSAGYTDKGFIQLSTDNIRIGTNSGNISGKVIIRTGGADRVFVDNSGNVAIGTSQVASGYKVSVNGKMMCEELKVQLNGNWPDYVFANQYKLMPIAELKKFIDSQNHLPNIPTAAEVKKNGIAVGDMQKKMMEKIEELTLYIIDLQKQIDGLKNSRQ